MAHCQPSLKISCKSVRPDRQSNRQRRLHILLDGGKKKLTTPSVRSCSYYSYTGYQSDNEWNLSSLCWSTRRSTTCRAPLYLSDDCQLVVTTGRRQLQASDSFKCLLLALVHVLEIQPSLLPNHAFRIVFSHVRRLDIFYRKLT